jgi:hypothetical protein
LASSLTYENSPANLGVTTSWARYSITAVVDTASTKNIIVFIWSDVTDTTLGDFLYITDVQLEYGSVATRFTSHAGTVDGELAACRRYLPAFSGSASTIGAFNGYAYATNGTIYTVQFDVPTRVAPTGITASGTFSSYGLNTAYSSTPTFNVSSRFSANIVAAPSITAGQGSRLELGTDSLLLFTGCEL